MDEWLIHLFQGSPPPTPFSFLTITAEEKKKSAIGHFSGADYGILSNE